MHFRCVKFVIFFLLQLKDVKHGLELPASRTKKSGKKDQWQTTVLSVTIVTQTITHMAMRLEIFTVEMTHMIETMMDIHMRNMSTPMQITTKSIQRKNTLTCPITLLIISYIIMLPLTQVDQILEFEDSGIISSKFLYPLKNL